MLKIPEEELIPLTLLDKIVSADVGEIVKNPTKKGKRYIKVTRLLKKRAVLARNMKRYWRK